MNDKITRRDFLKGLVALASGTGCFPSMYASSPTMIALDGLGDSPSEPFITQLNHLDDSLEFYNGEVNRDGLTFKANFCSKAERVYYSEQGLISSHEIRDVLELTRPDGIKETYWDLWQLVYPEESKETYLNIWENKLEDNEYQSVQVNGRALNNQGVVDNIPVEQGELMSTDPEILKQKTNFYKSIVNELRNE